MEEIKLNMHNNNQLSILIFSCDAYRDCWEPMLHSLDTYWPDCPYHRYVISNHASIEWKDTTFIKVGDHQGFGNDMRKALQQIPTKYVMYFQEDNFLDTKIDNQIVSKHLSYCIDNRIDFLKLSYDALPRDRYRIGQTDYCQNPINIRYSINTAVAIWDTKALFTLSVPGFSIWDFEKKILKYIQDNNININSQVLYSKVCKEKGITPILGNGIQGGKWTRKGVEFLRTHGFEHLICTRPIIGKVRTFLFEYSFIHRWSIPVCWTILKIMKRTKIGW